MSAVDTLRNALYGNPPSVSFKPNRDGVLSAFEELVKTFNAFLGGVAFDGDTAVYAARDTLHNHLEFPDRTLGLVYADADNTRNGIYIKNGSVGSGSWVYTGLMGVGPRGVQGFTGASFYDIAVSTGYVPAGTTEDAFIATVLEDIVAAGTASITSSTAAAAAAAALAADAAGIDRTFATRAAATGFVNNELVQIIVDETQDGARTLYRVVNGGLVLLSKIGSVFTDLSNVAANSTIPGGLRIGAAVPNSSYLGGVNSVLQVAGLMVAQKLTNGGEHRFIMNWDGNNAMSIQNQSNNDGYSATRYLDYQGREGCAVGYGNPGGEGDLPFRGAGYFETSNFINADGSSTPGPIRPLRFVQTGVMARRDGTSAMGVYTRASFEADGSFNFFDLRPVWSTTSPRVLFKLTAQPGFYGASFFDTDSLAPILRVRSVNGYERAGIVVGQTFAGTPFVPPPQVAADVVGTVLAGKGNDQGRSEEYTQAGVAFPFTAYDGDSPSFRHVRPGVGKYDIMFLNPAGAKPLRYAIVDRDHAGKEVLWAALDGSGNVGVAGNVGFNDNAPVAPAPLPAALPTDGSAANAAMATMLNAIRASLIAVGLNVSA